MKINYNICSMYVDQSFNIHFEIISYARKNTIIYSGLYKSYPDVPYTIKIAMYP